MKCFVWKKFVNMKTLCKDVGSYSTSSLYDFSIYRPFGMESVPDPSLGPFPHRLYNFILVLMSEICPVDIFAMTINGCQSLKLKFKVFHVWSVLERRF